MRHQDRFVVIDDSALGVVSGGFGPALYGLGVLAARAAPYIARAAPHVGKAIQNAWTHGADFIKNATIWTGAAETASRITEHQTGAQVPRPSDLMMSR